MTDALKSRIRHVPDFPKAGILFYDVTTLLRDPHGFRLAIDAVAAPFVDGGIDLVVGIESRGFILGSAVADRIGAGVLANDLMHERLEGLAGNDPVGAALEKCRGEFPLETNRDGEVARIVPIATAHDAQHTQPGFTLATRSQTRHRRTVALSRFAVRGVAGGSSKEWGGKATHCPTAAPLTPAPSKWTRREPANPRTREAIIHRFQ